MTASAPCVLILDDEAAIRRSLGRFLASRGYAALEAETVEQAVDALQSQSVCALVLDVRLPGHRSGLEVLSRVRARQELARLPVLILTGAVLTDAEETAIVRQRAHLFYKPEGFANLARFLDELTGREQSH